MLKRFASAMKGSATPLTLPAGDRTTADLFYYLATARWHMDQRPIVNVLLVHDLVGSAESWSPLTNAIARFPQGPFSPANPLYMYAVELRGHRNSPSLPEDSDVTMMSHVCDVSAFCAKHFHHSSETPAHVVGLGFGARVAALHALANPESTASLTLLLPQGNLFANAELSLPKLQLVAEVAQKSKSLADCHKSLRAKVPNPTELANLLHHLVEDAATGQVKLTLDCRQLASPSLVAWPSSIGNGVKFGPAQPVTVLHSSSTIVDAQVVSRTKALFPAVNFVATSANLTLGGISREDGSLLAEQLLQFSAGIVQAQAPDNEQLDDKTEQ